MMDRRSVAVIVAAVWSIGTALAACSPAPPVTIDDADANDASSVSDAPTSADGSFTDVAATCRPPRTECSDGCVDTKSDRANCGACGTVCAAGLVCSSGSCALECSGGTTRCGDACRDLMVDRANCGACDHACDAGHVCVSGACVLSCAPGQVACDGTCIDPRTSRTHCGATLGCGADSGADAGTSGTACNSGEVCADGVCALSCPSNLVACGGTCIDPETNANHCGATSGCGVDGGSGGSACAAGSTCAGGTCAVTCPPGFVVCGSTCVDPATSRAHCGATAGCGADAGSPGTSCASGFVCAAGTCALSCPGGMVECGGTCIDPNTSRMHCGATEGCGVDAGTAGTSCSSGFVCAAGTCALSCPSGMVECGGTCVDPNTSRTHCGATAGCGDDAGTSGTTCADGHVCTGGTCVLSCPSGMAACNGTCIDATSTCGTPPSDAGLDAASADADASDASANVDSGPDYYCNGVYDYDFSSPKQVTIYQTDLFISSHPRGYVQITSCATGSVVAGLGDEGISTTLLPAGKYRQQIVKIDTVPPDYPSYYNPMIVVEPPWPLPPATPIALPASGGSASERVVSSTAGNWTYVVTVPPESDHLLSISVTINVPEPADFGVSILGGIGWGNGCSAGGLGPNRYCVASVGGVPAGDYTITTNVQPGGKFQLDVRVQ